MKVRLILLAAVTSLFVACSGNAVYDEHLPVDKSGWDMGSDLRFNIDIEDTVQPLDFYIDVRNTRNYAYSNLFLFITTTFPDKVVRRDTLECPLADQYGEWYGHQTGRHIDGRYLLHKRVVFPIKGNYTFQITHAMRDTVLTGLKDIGLHVEKSY